jgi:hypothetical protein
MHTYDELVEVRRGMLPGSRGQVEGPAQFLWRGRLWKVSDVVARRVETGPAWHREESPASRRGREVWRVHAAPGRDSRESVGGVFDLTFEASRGTWSLVRCAGRGVG